MKTSSSAWHGRATARRYVAGASLALLAVVATTLFAHHDSHASAAAAPLRTDSWRTLQDAREQAFSIAVPADWKTYGGLFRFSTVDARLIVDMTSPNGDTNIRVGDATVPPYTVPGPFIRRGPHMAPYASGSSFATKYGQARFESMCQRLQLTSSRTLTPKYHAAGEGLIHTTAGEATFTCIKGGNAMAAYVYAETTLVGRGEPGSNWTVSALGSLLAPAERAEAAAAILQHSGESLVVNPAWMQMQTQLTNQAIRQINASTRATIAATSAENSRERAMISALQNDSFNDVINGVSLAVDPSTGQRYEVPLGTGNAQWIDGGHTVIESALSPGPGFNRLQNEPRQ